MRKLVLMLILICLLALPVKAYEVPDATKEGSITVTLRCGNVTIKDCEMIIYQIGEIRESDGNYNFEYTKDFAECAISLDNLQSAQTARDLSNFVIAKKMRGTIQVTDADGVSIFKGLQPGLYLIRQSKAAEGYEKTAPFLVTLPMLVGEEYNYHVDAGPKISPMEKSDEQEQPKTGQSVWPIWMFLLSGAGLLTIVLRRRY